MTEVSGRKNVRRRGGMKREGAANMRKQRCVGKKVLPIKQVREAALCGRNQKYERGGGRSVRGTEV